MIRLLLALGCCFIWLSSASAQFYETGQDPASVHWNQIKTPHFRVVYPRGTDSIAQRTAHLLEFAYPFASHSITAPRTRIPVLLHNYSSISNGLVVWAPKRMELYPTPPQDVYAQDWLEQLTLHELRHVVQLRKLSTRFGMGLYILLGEQSTGAMSSLVPGWFYEGDAVYFETVSSLAGRGRLPSFQRHYRSLALSNTKIYPFAKQVQGSYKHYIPGRYELGYQLVSYTRARYGTEIWNNALRNVAGYPYILFPFAFSIKKQTGKLPYNLYREAWASLDSSWTSEKNLLKTDSVHYISPQTKRGYVSYRFPKPYGNSIIALEESLDKPRRLVQHTSSGKVKQLAYSGTGNIDQISMVGNQLVWTEYRPDPRWAHRNYSVIKSYNFDTQTVRTLTTKSRYFAPALSPDGLQIATIEITPSNHCRLILIETKTGKPLQQIQVPDGLFIQTPAWNAAGTKLASSFLSKRGKGVIEYYFATDTWNTRLAETSFDVSHPFYNNDSLFCRGTFNGIDNLFYISAEGALTQYTHSAFGASDGFWCNDSLLYADYTMMGNRIAKMARHELTPETIDSGSFYRYRLIDSLARLEKVLVLPDSATNNNYEVNRYHKITQLFNIHSWAPIHLSYGYQTLETQPNGFPGIAAVSQNLLGTSIASVGYHRAQDDNFYTANWTYKGWYPQIELGLKHGGKPYIEYNEQYSPQSTASATSYDINISVPLNFTRGSWLRGIQPAIIYQYTNETLFNPATNQAQSGLNQTGFRFFAYNQLIKATRDIHPRMGQQLDVRVTSYPFEPNQLGTLWYARGVLYFPGLITNHSVKLTAGLQTQQIERYLSKGFIEFPRGIQWQPFKEMYRYSAEYLFPIWYPDWNPGFAFYLKRVHLNAFIDGARSQLRIYENARSIYRWTDFNVSGIEVFAEFHLFNIPVPLTLGYRAAYNYELKSYTGQVLFLFSLNDF